MPTYKQATPAQKKTIEAKLNACASMEEIFSVLAENFDLKNCKPGLIVKRSVVAGLVNTVLPMVNPNFKE